MNDTDRRHDQTERATVRRRRFGGDTGSTEKVATKVTETPATKVTKIKPELGVR